MVTACSTTPVILPEKYMLDAQLERVDEIQDIRAGRSRPAFSDFGETGAEMSNPEFSNAEETDEFQGFPDPNAVIQQRDTVTLDETRNEWIKVDNQSFIIRSVKNEYYLVILDRPAINLMTTNTITFRIISNSLRARADHIEIGNIPYLIERIYKINSRDQLYAITNQILTQP
jgi:hypothetical protein